MSRKMREARLAATSYRRGTKSHNYTNGTTETQWGNKLTQYNEADRVRIYGEVGAEEAIQYADQQPASLEEWTAHMFAAGLDKATRAIIARDVAAASWSKSLPKLNGAAIDCKWLADHKCAISPWDSAHYKGQRKLPPKQHRAASGKAGNKANKEPANDAHRQGKRLGKGGKPPSKTPTATYKAGKTGEAVSVQLKEGARKLATALERAADPRAFLEPHKRDLVKGVRGQATCTVYLIDAVDAGNIVEREHDHETGKESVSPVGHTANRGFLEHVRALKNQGATCEEAKLWAQGMLALLGRGAGVPPEILAHVAEARASARSCSWPARDALLSAPSHLEAEKAAREAGEATAAGGALDDDDRDDEAQSPAPGTLGPLADSDEEAEWQDPAADGHAEAASAFEAAAAAYLSQWGGDARADDVFARVCAAFDARDL